MNFRDRTGERYHNLVALRWERRRLKSGVSRVYWECKCDCGNVVFIGSTTLNHQKSCGCGRGVTLAKVKPGLTGDHTTPGKLLYSTWKTWKSMHDRCIYPKASGFKYYGGRGISVCDRWGDFKTFLSDMGVRPDGLSLDRINVDGNYEPNNCRWATVTEQARNKRNSRLIEYGGETKNLSEWAAKFKMKICTLHARLKRGLSMRECLSLPYKKVDDIYGRRKVLE